MSAHPEVGTPCRPCVIQRSADESKERERGDALEQFGVEFQYSDDLGVARCMRHIWRWHVVSCVHYRGCDIFARGCTGMGGASKHVGLRRDRICGEVVE